MTKRRSKRSRPRSDDVQDEPGSPKTPPSARRWIFRFVAIVGGPAFFLILIELLLRLVGFGYTTAFLVPCQTGDGEALCTNLKATWSYFPPEAARQPISTTVSRHKPSGTYRIFVLGASAAQGDPQPAFSFARILQVMLEARYPKTNFEVVNTAITAVNSHVVRDIASDCAQREPDLFIVYLGNNEVVGPFGPGSVFSPLSGSASIRRSVTQIKKTRVAQLIQRFGRVFGAARSRDWGGMAMFLGNQIPWQHKKLESVYDHFRQNLQDICMSAAQHGAQTALCTVGTNLSDCPPFASLHRPDLTSDERGRWESAYASGQDLQRRGDYEDAITAYHEAAAIDDRYAELTYRMGQANLTLARRDEARRLFALARDTDTLRFRADSPINRIIREVAASRSNNSTQLIDFSRDLENVAQDGTPGEAFFFDHVHLTFHGNYLLALSLFRAMPNILPVNIQQGAAGASAPMTEEQCAERLALSDWDRLLAVEDIVGRLRRPPFSHQLDSLARLQQQEERMTQLRAITQPEQLSQIAARYESVLAQHARDHQIRFNYAMLLSRGLSRFVEAESHLRRVVHQVPHDVHAWCVLADVLFEQGKTAEAVTECRHALRADPLDYTAYSRLGRFLLALGRVEEAVAAQKTAIELKPIFQTAHTRLQEALRAQGRLTDAITFYSKAVDGRPDSTTLRVNYAKVLAETGRVDQAIFQLRKSIEVSDDNLDARLALGRLMADRDTIEAVAQLQAAIEIAPQRHEPHVELGDALLTAGRLQEAGEQYDEVIRLKPRMAGAQFMRGFVSDKSGKNEEAVYYYEKALSLDPNLANAHHRLGDLLARQGQFDVAAVHFTEWVRLEPNLPQSRHNLALVLSQLGQPAAAIKQLREIVRLKPDRFESHYNLGTLLFAHERIDEAFGAWSRAAQLSPNHAEVHHKIAVALFQLGLKDEAVTEITEAIRLNPQHVNAHRNLGRFLADLHRLDEAAAQFETAIKLDPSDEATKLELDGIRQRRTEKDGNGE
ncbi:MAG: tetratricopeptide repeat protein [Planctomycetes bacterium]|nr:tetratricopeptide repeat protein [Planctomycetota bacterium]